MKLCFKPFPPVTNEEFYNATNIIETLNITETIQYLVLTNVEKYLQNKVAVEFWSYFTKAADECLGFQQYTKAVQVLYDYYLQFANIMAKVDAMRECNRLDTHIYNEKNAIDALKLTIRATLLAQLPIEHKTIIENFYELALKMEEGRGNISIDETCKICTLEVVHCNCMHIFYETNK